MKILGTTLGWNFNKVTAGITLGVLRVNSASRMKRLMKITNIVDKQSESVGL